MQYYFNKMSPIKFKYPQNKEFPWALEFWDNNFEKAWEIEKKTKINIDWEEGGLVTEDDRAC